VARVALRRAPAHNRRAVFTSGRGLGGLRAGVVDEFAAGVRRAEAAKRLKSIRPALDDHDEDIVLESSIL
jgi:hypothetical protein